MRKKELRTAAKRRRKAVKAHLPKKPTGSASRRKAARKAKAKV